MMPDRLFLLADVALRRWRLYAVRFALLAFAWAATSIAFQLPSGLLLKTLGEGLMFAVFVSLLFYFSERGGKGARIAMVLTLVVLSMLLVARIWTGGR